MVRRSTTKIRAIVRIGANRTIAPRNPNVAAESSGSECRASRESSIANTREQSIATSRRSNARTNHVVAARKCHENVHFDCTRK